MFQNMDSCTKTPEAEKIYSDERTMTSLAIREDIQHFVDEILQWDFYTDVIDDHDDSEAARARLDHGSTFYALFVRNASLRCRNPFDSNSFQESEGVCRHIRPAVLTGIDGADPSVQIH